MSLSTPNFVVTKDINDFDGSGWLNLNILLVAGAFVRPLHISYVPKHVLDNPRYQRFNPNKEVFCYTAKGIIPILMDVIRTI